MRLTNVLFLTAVCPCATHSSPQAPWQRLPHCALFHLSELGCLPPLRLPSGGACSLNLQEECTPLTSTGLRLGPKLSCNLLRLSGMRRRHTWFLEQPPRTSRFGPAAGRECLPGRQGARCAAGGRVGGALGRSRARRALGAHKTPAEGLLGAERR